MRHSHFIFQCCLFFLARHLEFVSVSSLKQLTQVLYLSLLRQHSREGLYPCLGTREKLSWCSQCHEHRELMTWHSSTEASIIKNQSSLPEELAQANIILSHCHRPDSSCPICREYICSYFNIDSLGIQEYFPDSQKMSPNSSSLKGLVILAY